MSREDAVAAHKQYVNMYSFYDTKAGLYEAPWLSINNATAIRTFSELISKPGTRYHQQADDIALYAVGKFCDEDCSIVLSDRVRLIQGNELRTQLQGS